MIAQESAVADHRVAVHPGQPRRGPNAVAIGEVFDQCEGLLLGQARSEQRGPLPLGGAGLAGAAVEQPILPSLAVATADGRIAVAPLARVGALRVLAAEAGQVLVHGSTSVILG